MTRRALPSQLCRDLLTCAAQLMLCMTAADLAAAPLLSRADPTESAASQSKASQFSHDFAELDSVCHFCTGLTSSPISWQRGHKSASKSSEALSLDSLQLRHINPIHPRRDSDLESPSSDPDSVSVLMCMSPSGACAASLRSESLILNLLDRHYRDIAKTCQDRLATQPVLRRSKWKDRG